MDLSVAGLNESESKCYLALLENEYWKPNLLGKYIGLSRTNTYKVLENLEAKGLAERLTTSPTLAFRASHPSVLTKLAEDKKRTHEDLQSKLELDVSALAKTFLKAHDTPGLRTFYGKDEIKQIFIAISESKSAIHFISTIAGIDFYGYDHMHHLRMMAVRNKVKRIALTPDTTLATQDYNVTDKKFYLERTWLENNDYTAPVEWGVFEDTLYIISFGNDAMGVMIDSPFIAAGFLQLFKLIQKNQINKKDYIQLPRLAQKKAMITSANLQK